MYALDITTNNNYTNEFGDTVYGLIALQVYSYTLSYNTLIDEKWTANEQRRAQWTSPRRTWTIDFKKTPALGRKLEDFFKATMGKFKAFRFKWSKSYEDGTDMGGDDKWYYVRFNTDDLKVNIDYLGYRQFQVELIEVRNGA